MKTKVIFRKFKDGEGIIALFPELSYPEFTSKKGLIMDYTYIGQHGECEYNTVMKMTTIAFPKDYEVLKAQLKDLGYDLEVTTHKEYQKSLTV